MKIAIISYSSTGNNDTLASNIAKEIGANHIKVTRPHAKATCIMIIKHLFNKAPKVEPPVEVINQYDFVILCGPIWMGKIAAPLRAYLDYLKSNPHKYAFVSLCGGATGPNSDLENELEKRTGNKPVVLVEYRIASLLPQDPKPGIKDTMAYRINDADLKKVTDTIVSALKKHI